MLYRRQPRPPTVSERGAVAGSVLFGCGPNNLGLRIRVLGEQPRGHGGPVQGRFVIVDAGDNMHADSLAGLLHRETDAAEVLGVIRRGHGCCVSVANMNALTADPPGDSDERTPRRARAAAR